MKGISKFNNKYKVVIGKKYYGLFNTLEEAIIVRDKAIENVSNKYNSYYFNNVEMYKEIVVSKAIGRLSNKLFNKLLEIVKGVSRKFRYDNEDDRYDCEAYAIEMILKNWYNFDEDRFDNVFAYFTEVIKRAFATQYKKLNKSRIDCITINDINI